MDFDVLTIHLLCFSQSEGHLSRLIQKLWQNGCLTGVVADPMAAHHWTEFVMREAVVNLAKAP
jgi:hypothetical protein